MKYWYIQELWFWKYTCVERWNICVLFKIWLVKMSFSRWKTDRYCCGYGCEDTWQATFASFYCINFSSYHNRLVLTLIANVFFVLSISYNMHKETGLSLFSISSRSTFPSTSMIGLKNMVFTFSFMSEFIAWWWKQPKYEYVTVCAQEVERHFFV